MVRSGSRFDTLKGLDIRELEQRIEKIRLEASQTTLRPRKLNKVITGVQYLVANGHLTQEKATTLLAAVEKRRLSVDDAFAQIQALVEERADRPAVRASCRERHVVRMS